ncbi:telomerase-binding protein EST1A-like [Bolinopsis microptera]|uniref:telomerase-binding protein EST1A-like n=1 Tax=Bolinopsis microptera TaxID=2820187 RepID=UPI00307A3112
MADPTPPNFHLSYEKLKKLAEELRGGGDKDADYWAWRKGGGSDSSSEEDDFMKWISNKRNGKPDGNRNDDRNRKQDGKRNSNRGNERSIQNRVSENGPRSSYRRQPRDKSPDESRGRPRDRPRVKSGESSLEERDKSVESGEREDPKHPTKRERRRRKKMDDHSPVGDRQPALWDPGDWEKGPRPYLHGIKRDSRTAKGGGVIKLPSKIKYPEDGGRHAPVGEVRTNSSQGGGGPNDFIYSDSGSDSDGNFTEEYSAAAAISPQLNSSVLNVIGIEKRIEKCAIEATQCSSTFCKESCNKFLGEGMRKRNSLDVLYESFEEHHTEIIHLRQELACVVSCGMMYDLDICQDLQAESVLWKNIFYLLIQYYRNSITNSNSDSVKATLSQQLEEHIGEGISFYNMLIRQIQKRYKVNYKHHTTGHNRSQVLALLLLHKLFLWIGDLYRYLSQTRDTDEWGQARNYYLLAQTLAPRNPRPYHQLALLGKYAHRRLHAVYYFTLSLLVRNPFSQSKELLLAVLAELRRKALLLQRRDEDRSKRNQILPGSKEVYSNKVIEWVFEQSGDQSLSIPPPDLRKRFVVYLLSCLGGFLSNIDLDRVDSEFQCFLKFYRHYIKLTSFESDEVYVQLFVVQLYTIHKSSHSARAIEMLEQFLIPSLDLSFISATEQGDEWLCNTHSPLSLIFLLSQSSEIDSDVIEKFSVMFKKKLIDWLNVLQSAITRYRKYTDFTEESVVLKEVTMLRGIELLSSLQNITKPFYLNNLTREQSEDLGRAVLIVSTFEKLAANLTFLGCTESRNFEYLDSKTEQIVTKSEIDVKEGETVDAMNEEGVVLEEVELGKAAELSDEDSGSDLEIISVMKITHKTGEGEGAQSATNNVEADTKFAEEDTEVTEEDTEVAELLEKKGKLLQTLQDKQDRKDEMEAAVKQIQGMRIRITVKPKYIIPDTNCFLDTLDKMQRLVMSSYKLLIPLVVLDEITGLCKSSNKGERAAQALDSVNKFIADKSVALLTSKGSILESREFKEERARQSNDDLILNGVLSLSESTGHTAKMAGTQHITRVVVFLTDDSNLRVKAHSYNLAVQTISDFLMCAKL